MEEGRLIALYGLLFAAGYFVMMGIAIALAKLIFPKIELEDDDLPVVNKPVTVRNFPEAKSLRSQAYRERQHARSLRELQQDLG